MLAEIKGHATHSQEPQWFTTAPIPAKNRSCGFTAPVAYAPFEAAAAASGNPKAASNWIMGELTRKMNELGARIEDMTLTPEALAGLIRLVDSLLVLSV